MEKPVPFCPPHSRKELLQMLKLEEATVASQGFRLRKEDPLSQLQPFRDSVTCLTFGKEGLEPCDLCWLMGFVQQEQNGNELPCHLIPLNSKGETVASLTEAGDPERLKHEVLGWLRTEIARLEQEIQHSENAGQ